MPAYNPDGRLLELLARLRGRFSRLVLVDDGSVSGREIFERAKGEGLVEKILVHDRNRGKGAALKTAFAYLGDSADVVTADADGQHTPEDIAKIADALATHRNGLVLGVRSFAGKVPLRSRFGNFWTRWMFFLMTGLTVSDTQTGLRGIPAALVPRVASLPGERYEYEMAMLADARYHPEKPFQIPIETVYVDGNATSHFNPLLDSIRIYRSLFQFCVSSVLSFLLDNAVFAAAIWFLAAHQWPRRDGIFVAFAAARAVSSHFNYFYNRFVVFRRRRRPNARHRSYGRYIALVVAVGIAGYALTEVSAALLGVKGVAVTLVKIVSDIILFFASYEVQKRFVFRPSV